MYITFIPEIYKLSDPKIKISADIHYRSLHNFFKVEISRNDGVPEKLSDHIRSA